MRYSGSVSLPRGLRVSYVEQEPPTPSGTCRHDACVERCSVLVSTDIKVFDSLLGIQDMQSETADSDRTASIYATARRYQKAAQNAADDRT